MQRRLDHVAHRADLGDAPRIHHGDAVRGLGDHAHVVGDQHHGGAMLAAQPLQQRDDLRLHRYVERGGRLVGDDEFRLGRERQRQHHTLAHAAGELMRIGIDAHFRRRDANFIQQRQRFRACLRIREVAVRLDGLDQLLADAVERVEAGERVLEHHADALAADLAHRFRRQVVDALPAQQHLASGDPPRRLDQADHRRAGDRLAGAGFADHAENFARRDVERHAVDRREGAAAGRKLDFQIAHAEDGFGHRSLVIAAWDSRHRAASRPTG